MHAPVQETRLTCVHAAALELVASMTTPQCQLCPSFYRPAKAWGRSPDMTSHVHHLTNHVHHLGASTLLETLLSAAPPDQETTIF